ncbi:putative F-box domain-containing protein [Helianthus debilis subsp. tardiflorus]
MGYSSFGIFHLGFDSFVRLFIYLSIYNIYDGYVRNTMALKQNLEFGLVKRTSSFGRKRILILNHMDFDSVDVSYVTTPRKKQFVENCCEKSLLEALPQEILIKILCGVEHDDLKRLFHVSKPIREAVVIAKKWYFEYSTPKKTPAFRCSLNMEEFPSSDFNFDKIKTPNAPKQMRIHRPRAGICVSLFSLSP